MSIEVTAWVVMSIAFEVTAIVVGAVDVKVPPVSIRVAFEQSLVSHSSATNVPLVPVLEVTLKHKIATGDGPVNAIS